MPEARTLNRLYFNQLGTSTDKLSVLSTSHEIFLYCSSPGPLFLYKPFTAETDFLNVQSRIQYSNAIFILQWK